MTRYGHGISWEHWYFKKLYSKEAAADQQSKISHPTFGAQEIQLQEPTNPSILTEESSEYSVLIPKLMNLVSFGV